VDDLDRRGDAVASIAMTLTLYLNLAAFLILMGIVLWPWKPVQ
jgi:hypothetical protein